MVWKPHFLNIGKSLVLSLVNGEVKRNVLIPNLIVIGKNVAGRGIVSKAKQREL